MSNFRASSDYLPDDIVKHFTALDFMVMRFMNRLFTKRKEVIALEYADIHPSEIAIGKAVGATVSAISRSLGRLHQLGAIKIIRRRRSDGTFYINRYTIGDIYRALFSLFQRAKKALKYTHLRNQTTYVNKKAFEDDYEGELADISRRAALQSARPGFT